MKRDSLILPLLGTALAFAAGLSAFAAEPAKPAVATAAKPVAAATPPKTAAPAKVAMTKPPAASSVAAAKPAVSAASSKPASAAATTAKPAATPAAPAKPATPPAPAPKPAEPPKPAIAEPGIPKGLVLHYTFDAAEAKAAITDTSGQNNHGIYTGARWITSGKQGGGLEFTAPTNYVKVPNSASLNPKHATFAVWFRTSRSDGVWRRVFEKGSYSFGIAGDTKGVPTRGKFSIAIRGASQCLSDHVLADGSWHHAAATCDGQNVKLYIDGVLQQQVAPFRGQIQQTADDLTIGLVRTTPAIQDPVQSFEGALDDVMIFNRALSEEELQAMVYAVDPNAAKPRFSKAQVAGRIRQLRMLFEEGLLTDEFYTAKLSECEAAGQ